MQAFNERSKAMRFTAIAVGMSFLSMLFVLISLGVAWRSVDYNGIQVDATLLFIVVRNTELMKKAGDPAFALLFIGSCFQLFSVYALYLRWAGRESRFPHNAVACMTLFGISSIFTFLSFVVFSGIVNTNPAPSNPIDQSGHYGSGFGLTIYLFLTDVFIIIGLYKYHGEIDAPKDEASETAMSYSDNKDAGAPFRPEVFKAQWQKSRIHTTAMGVSVINLVLLIMALGLPWWSHDVPATSFGLVQTFTDLKTAAKTIGYPFDKLKTAGDAGFAFTFFAFISQIYATAATTLRFLGRNDGFSGRIPHTLNACLISNGVACFCEFLAWVIYAGVMNSGKQPGDNSKFIGGFGLIVSVWLFTLIVVAILFVKKKEVDDAPLPADNTIVTAFPTPANMQTNPAASLSSPPPPPFPTTLYAASIAPPTPEYGQSYPSAPYPAPAYVPTYTDSPGGEGGQPTV